MKEDKTMLLSVLFMYITSVSTEELEVCTTCIKVDATCYNISYLFEINAPFRNTIVINKLGLLRSTNTLFYSFEPKIEDEEYYKVGFTHLDNPVNSSVISGGKQIMNFGTFDFDQDNSLVYLGGSDGVYVLDAKLNRVAPYSSRGDRVVSLFYNGYLYFVRDNEYKIVKKKGDNFDIVIDSLPVKTFVVNKYNVIVFLSNHGLFATRGEEITWLSTNAFFRGLVMHEDVVYAWWVDGIYKVIIEPKFTESRVVKVAHVPSIGALSFDKDHNFLFTAGKSLYRLIETTAKVC